MLQRQALRKHQGGAGGIVPERIPLELIAIGIHVVKPVADAFDVVVANFGAIHEREIDSVAHITDDVAADDVSGRVPDVDAVATAVLIECDDAQLSFGGLQPVAKRICEFRRLGPPDDGVAFDPGAIGLPDVDTVETLSDLVATHDHAGTGHVDACVIQREIEAGAADFDPFDSHVVGPYGDDMCRAVTDKRRTSMAGEPDGPRDGERTGVDAGRNIDCLAHRRRRQPGTQPGPAIE